MTNIENLRNRILSLIAQRDAGADTQTQIDALMIQMEAIVNV
jgi:hypothetical protein